MAGEQSKAMSFIGADNHSARKNVKTKGLTRYAVPDHNKPVSSTYFNSVKAYMESSMPAFCKQCETRFGEKQWWRIVREEMDRYCFGYEGNQALYLYAKYKKEVA